MGKKECKINILAMNRKSTYCMSPLIPDEGNVFVASDVGSAEPTILLNLCEDPTLYSILYEQKGKKPSWQGNILLTDSMYITTMSSTPLLGPLLRDLGGDWVELYYKDSDEAKKKLGSKYALSKKFVLALLYGLGKKSLGADMRESNVIMTNEEVAAVYNGFWDSIPQARDFRDVIAHMFKKAYKEKRPFMSPFGLPLPSSQSSKGFNYIIQSSVSSFIRRLNMNLLKHDWIKLVTVIHDELVMEVPKDRVDEYRTILKNEEKYTNDLFGFKYPLNLGFNVANSFYGLKG